MLGRRAGGDGDLIFLAQFLGHRYSGLTVPLSLVGTFAVLYDSATGSIISR